MKYASLPGGGRIPVLGLGTWGFGGGTSAVHSRDEEWVRTLNQAIEMGYTHFDTAEMYGGGHTEELLGRAIQETPREDLFITSKVDPGHLRYDQVHTALDGSLKRLGTDYLDLYLIHWPNSRVPLEETFRALNEAVKRGKVKYLGVSNFDRDLLEQARRHADTPIVTDQVPYSLFNRRYAKNGTLAYCQENDILLMAYTPVDHSELMRSDLVRELAEKYGATPHQIALNWLVRQPKVITIPKSENPEHMRENLASVDLEISDEDARRLSEMR